MNKLSSLLASFALVTSFALVSAAALGLSACGGDDNSSNPDLAARDMSAKAADMTITVDLASNADMAGFQVIQSCGFTDFVDDTAVANARAVTPWDTSLGKRCLIIKVGQTVTWSPAPSATHPLAATTGTTPSPITNAATATFTAPGIYGFHCENHPGLMQGAIWVQP